MATCGSFNQDWNDDWQNSTACNVASSTNNCDIRMFYGNYRFDPVPIITINKQFDRKSDGKIIGGIIRMTLTGKLMSGTESIYNLMRIKQKDMREGLNRDGELFYIEKTEQRLFESYPKILSINFDASPDNWVFSVPYVIEMEMNTEPVGDLIPGMGEDSDKVPPFISDCNESWNMEFVQDQCYYKFRSGLDSIPYRLNVTHSVSAVGKREFQEDGLRKEAWEEAKEFVEGKLGFKPDLLVGTGIINLNDNDVSNTLIPYNHFRSQSIDEAAGIYGVTETWLVLDQSVYSLTYPAIEDFSVVYRKASQDTEPVISVEGTIKGLETRSYGTTPDEFAVTQDGYTAAESYWNNIKASTIYLRASEIATQNGITIINDPESTQISHSPTQCSIGYSYVYDSQNSVRCIDGAKSERISISDNNPTDIFAQIVVPGRLQGPILQALNTVTPFSRTVSIEAVMSGSNDKCPCPTLTAFSRSHPKNPRTTVATLLNQFETDLEGSYDSLFKANDSENWDPIDLRYNRTVTWVATDCTVVPDTSFVGNCP